MRICDILLVSDVDGTLVMSEAGISPADWDAIQRFRALGGSFTLATGRSPTTARPWIDRLKIETPVICLNGGCIYDPAGKSVLWSRHLPSGFSEIVQRVMQISPPLFLEAVTDDGVHYISVVSAENQEWIEKNGGSFSRREQPESYPSNCCTVVFQFSEAKLSEIEAELAARDYPGVRFVRSGGRNLELIPQSVSKGEPLARLAALYGKPPEGLAAIGDFYNDISLLNQAAFSAAVGNAPDDVKACANLVVAPCGGGVAELIDHLLARCENSNSS